MKKFKYLKISKTKKLRYIDNYYEKNLYIIFLPGFMSNLEGIKEVLGDAVHYVNPLESQSIAKGIKEIFENIKWIPSSSGHTL